LEEKLKKENKLVFNGTEDCTGLHRTAPDCTIDTGGAVTGYRVVPPR